MKNIKELAKNFFIIILIFILIEVFCSKFIINENPIEFFGWSFLIVTTGSMEPEITAGELIIIKNFNDYKIGDIVTFLDQDDFLVTHRIINIAENYIITQGDNNDLPDEKILLENIKGKVIIHSKVLGFIVLYLLKPITFIYILINLVIHLIKKFFIRERMELEIEKKQEENNNDSNN